MKVRPDLHIHSSFSDGVLSPELLLYEAERAGVTLMAITDHDTFEGAEALSALDAPIETIPGVELSISDMPSLHLLAYGYAVDTPLHEKVRELARGRVERAQRILNKLDALGLRLDRKQLEKRYHGTVGRPHIARALVHEGHVKSMLEAFDRYLGTDKPAYEESERLDMRSALSLVRSSGFVPILAHPCELKKPDGQLNVLLAHWKDEGLMGVEVYHPSARSHGYEQLDRMARRMGLLVTGGSDFHQENDRHGRIGAMAQEWLQAEEDAAALKEALRQK